MSSPAVVETEEERAVATVAATAAVEDQPAALLRLQTDRSLGAGVRSGAKWMLGARVSAQLLQFAGVLITARLLFPSDYGKMAVVYPIVAFALIFSNLGLASSIIHVERVTERLLSTAFWMNALAGLALTAAVSALSYPLSVLFDEPQLVPLICLASLGFSIQVGVVHTALLERTLHFRAVAIIETAGAFALIATTVVAAAYGLGAFALVLGPLAEGLVVVLLRFARVRYVPRGWIDRGSVRELWSHAAGVTGFNIVAFWARHADNLLLAGTVSQAALGNYSRAYSLMRLPLDQTVAMMSRVMYPAMARLRHDPQRLGQAWLRALSVAVVITAPLTLLLAVSAPAAVEVLLGPRWTGMVGLLELLALGALPQVMIATAPAVLRATGHTGLLFRLGVLVAGTTIGAMVIGLPWGTRGVATALLVKFCLDVPWVLWLCARKASVGYARVLLALRGVLLACAVLLAAGYALRLALEGQPPWLVLVTQVLGCGLVYLGALALTDRKALTTALSLVKRAGV